MESIETRSTSLHSAIASDIVVRPGDQVRLIFRPEIVDNPHDPAACIKGTFVYQRKGKKELWADTSSASLATLKKGEGYKLELKSGELLPLLRQLTNLYRAFRKSGVPQGKQRYVRLEERLAEFLSLSSEDVEQFLDAHPKDALATLHKVLRWLTSSTSLAEFIETRGHEVSLLSAVIGVAGLRAILGTWQTDQENPGEEFWQTTLAKHSFVLSQLFSYPILLIAQKAYLGGKRVDNQHGSVADFLAKAESTGNALIVEIKTPVARLLGKEYRAGVFPPSQELAGALAQLLHYRDTFASQVSSVMPDESVLRTEPRGILVIGNAQRQLQTLEARQSFERFRHRLSGVEVVTFDELFGRVSRLAELLAP